MSHARIVAPRCCPFQVSSMNELWSGKFVHSIIYLLLPFEIFWCYLEYIYFRSRRCVAWKNRSPLSILLGYLPWINFIGESLLAEYLSTFNICLHWHSVLYHKVYILGWPFVTAYHLLWGGGFAIPSDGYFLEIDWLLCIVVGLVCSFLFSISVLWPVKFIPQIFNWNNFSVFQKWQIYLTTCKHKIACPCQAGT